MEGSAAFDAPNDEVPAERPGRGRRVGVSAEATATIGATTSGPVESYPKTPEQRRRLLDTIGRNGFLRELDMTLREKLVASMQLVECGPESAPLINEGELLGNADKWFVIERGAVTSSTAADLPGKEPKKIGPGDR